MQRTQWCDIQCNEWSRSNILPDTTVNLLGAFHKRYWTACHKIHHSFLQKPTKRGRFLYLSLLSSDKAHFLLSSSVVSCAYCFKSCVKVSPIDSYINTACFIFFNSLSVCRISSSKWNLKITFSWTFEIALVETLEFLSCLPSFWRKSAESRLFKVNVILWYLL